MLRLVKVKRDLAGERFGKLTVQHQVPVENGTSKWRCICDCGKEAESFGFCLTSGTAKSCGCVAADKARVRFKAMSAEALKKLGDHSRTHGMSKHGAFQSWADAKTRCFNTAHKWYPSYGGRGITMCQEWATSFEAFWSDLGDTWFQGAQIGRIDNEGDYTKENCRWETAKEQQNNKTNNCLIETPKGVMTVAQAAELWCISSGALRHRLKVGWPVEKALTKRSQRDHTVSVE